MNWNVDLSLRKLIYFQICAWLFSYVGYTKWVTGKQFFDMYLYMSSSTDLSAYSSH